MGQKSSILVEVSVSDECLTVSLSLKDVEVVDRCRA